MGPDEKGGTAGRWLDVRQTADELGISSDAVRKRIARGTLPSSKGENGSVIVWLVAAGQERGEDQPIGGTEAGRGPDALLDAKDETIRLLADQLASEREANRENRRIIAALTSRIPAIEAPRDKPDDPESVEEFSEGASPRSDTAGAQTTAREPEETSRRPWWLRWLGG